MSIKTIMSLSICGVLMACGLAFAACGEHATVDSEGNCQCEVGFVMRSDTGLCQHVQSSELNVLP